MPYNPASATKSITVQKVTVTLAITPSPPWTAGQAITLTATVLTDSSPWAGRTVNFRIYYDANVITIGSKTTGSDGKATLSYTIPWKIGTVTIPCKTVYFDCVEYETSTASSPISGKVAFPTRISISAPDSVIVNQYFTISGMLEYQSDSGVWSGLGGKTVSLFYNGTKIADVTTGSDGSYSKSTAISSPGTYTLKASYGGEGFALAVSVISITVSPEVETALMAALPILTGAALAFISLRS
jgi:hypothetical protein